MEVNDKQEFIATLSIVGGIILGGMLVASVLGFWALQLYRRKRKKDIVHEVLNQKRTNGTTITKQKF